MKTLFLIRHAKSSWDDTALPDKDRPLNDRGELTFGAESWSKIGKTKPAEWHSTIQGKRRALADWSRTGANWAA